MFIKEVRPSIIKNSRGEKTIQIEIETHVGKFKASAPSGKSTGKYAVHSYHPNGIDYSLRLLKFLAKKLKHKNFLIRKFEDLKIFESEMHRFERRHGSLGGNCVYALETCFLKAAAKEKKKELWEFINDAMNASKKPKMPMPIGNCIGGGLHSKNKKKNLSIPDFQEFLLIPKEKTFSRAITKNIHAYHKAKKLLKRAEKKIFLKTNDENAWQTSLTNEEVLGILYKIGKEFNIRIGVDIAASTFCDKKGYYQYKNKELIRDRQEQIDYVQKLIKKHAMFYVEDALQEEDFSGFKELLAQLNTKKTLIVGDDLTVTSPTRTRRAFSSKAINAIILKPNQIGYLSGVIKVVEFCKKNNLKIVFSHRSGETMDDALADYAVGFGAEFIKTGIIGKERLIKLKRVMEIEKSLG